MGLEFCFNNGIKPSEFDEWPEIDKARILGYSFYKKSLCQECGTLHQEWLDENGDELRPGQEGVTLDSRECPGCLILSVKTEGKDMKQSTKLAFKDKED